MRVAVPGEATFPPLALESREGDDQGPEDRRSGTFWPSSSPMRLRHLDRSSVLRRAAMAEQCSVDRSPAMGRARTPAPAVRGRIPGPSIPQPPSINYNTCRRSEHMEESLAIRSTGVRTIDRKTTAPLGPNGVPRASKSGPLDATLDAPCRPGGWCHENQDRIGSVRETR